MSLKTHKSKTEIGDGSHIREIPEKNVQKSPKFPPKFEKKKVKFQNLRILEHPSNTPQTHQKSAYSKMTAKKPHKIGSWSADRLTDCMPSILSHPW